MATIDDILNALRGQGYADGSTWMQQPQTQPDGPPMPTPPTGAPMPLAGAMPRHHAPRRPDAMPAFDPAAEAQKNRELAMAAFNMQPQMGQTAILPPEFRTEQPGGNRFGRLIDETYAIYSHLPKGYNFPAPGAPRSLADLAPANPVVASNGFAPFGGRY